MALSILTINDEEWRMVPGYSYLMVSNKGRVARIQEYSQKHGYPYAYTENDNCIAVHKLVALAFIGPVPENKPCINHIDGVKTNNDLTNLEYISYGDNHRHAYATGLRMPNGPHKLKGSLRVEAASLYKEGVSSSILAKKYQVSRGTILNAAKETR